MQKPKHISDRHRELVRIYFETGMNKTKAAELAGYKHSNGYIKRLFEKKDVAWLIWEHQSRLQKKFDISRDRIMREHAKAAFSDLSKFLHKQADGTLAWDFSEATDEELQAVAGLQYDYYYEGQGEDKVLVKKFKPEFHDKKGALEALARMQGFNKDKVEVTGELSFVERLQRGRDRAAAKNKKA
jgi:phage terminase small subunit